MNIPDDLLYTEEHEWVRVDGNVATIGITDYAQSELGDIVYVELPNVGDKTKQMEPFGTIEAVKAVSDLYAPLTGKVVEVNEALADSPDLVNKDPYGEGWMIRVEMADPSELEKLLSADDYKQVIGE